MPQGLPTVQPQTPKPIQEYRVRSTYRAVTELWNSYGSNWHGDQTAPWRDDTNLLQEQHVVYEYGIR